MDEQSRQRPWWALASVLAASVAVAACSAGSTTPPTASAPPASSAGATDDLVAAAQAEGSVTYYSVQQKGVDSAIAQAFQAKYGITVNLFEAAASDMATKFQAEVDSGNLLGDVVSISQHTILDKDKAALADISSLPNYANWPSKYATPNYALTSIQPKPILINTSLADPSSITKWSDIIAPKWKGQIVLADPKSAVSNAAFFVLLDQQEGDPFVQGLGGQTPDFEAGAAAVAQLVSSGEKAIGFPVSYSAITPLIAAKAPVAVVTIPPVPGAEIYTAATAKGPHPNAARLLLDFLMSTEGQQDENGNQLGASVLPNVPTSLPLPDGYVPTNEAVSQSDIDRVSALLGR